MSSALADVLEEMKADPKIVAAVASDPVSAGHLAEVEKLLVRLISNDGHAVELYDEAVKIAQQPGPVRERIAALHDYLVGVPAHKLRALNVFDVLPPPAEVRPGRLQ